MSFFTMFIPFYWTLCVGGSLVTSFARKCLTLPFPLTDIESYVYNQNSIIQLNEKLNFKLSIRKNHLMNTKHLFDVLVSSSPLHDTISTDLTDLFSTTINESYDIKQNLNGYREKYELVDWISFGTNSTTDTTDSFSLKQNVVATVTRKTIYQYNLLHRGIGVIVMNQQGEVYIHKRSNQKKVFPSMLDMFIGGVMNSEDESPDMTMLRELQEELGLDLSTPAEYSPSLSTGDTIDDDTAVRNRSFKSISRRFKYLRDDDKLLTQFPSLQENNCLFQLSEYARLLKRNLQLYKSVPNSSTNNNDSNDSKIFRLGKSTCCTSYNHCIVDCYLIICNDNQANSIHFADGEVEWGEWVQLQHLYQLIHTQESQFVPDGMQVWNDLPKLIVDSYS